MSDWKLIEEDVIYKEEILYKEPYTLRGVYYEGEEDISYKSIFGTEEPYSDGETSMMLPAGASSTDAKVFFSAEPLLCYSDTGDKSIADKVFLSDPEIGKTSPQRYVVMDRKVWKDNGGFKLLTGGNSNSYLLVKEEKVSHGI